MASSGESSCGLGSVKIPKPFRSQCGGSSIRCWKGCDRDFRLVDRYSNAERLSDLSNAAATVTPSSASFPTPGQPLSRQHGLRVIPALLAADPQLFWLNCLNTELCAIGHQQRWGHLTGAASPTLPVQCRRCSRDGSTTAPAAAAAGSSLTQRFDGRTSAFKHQRNILSMPGAMSENDHGHWPVNQIGQ